MDGCGGGKRGLEARKGGGEGGGVAKKLVFFAYVLHIAERVRKKL